MSTAPATNANVKQAVPFLGVTNMEASLRFYVDGLGFEIKHWWIPDRAEDKPDRRIRWCWVQRGGAAVMLQEFLAARRPWKDWGPEHPSVLCAKTRWHSIASSNLAEYGRRSVHSLETDCG
jgi:catechol 2,3-dioxygenase-like lactoylglutathione lyase family enzyme